MKLGECQLRYGILSLIRQFYTQIAIEISLQTLAGGVPMANYGELWRRFLWRIGPNSTAQFAIIRQIFYRSTIDLESFFCTDRLS